MARPLASLRPISFGFEPILIIIQHYRLQHNDLLVEVDCQI